MERGREATDTNILNTSPPGAHTRTLKGAGLGGIELNHEIKLNGQTLFIVYLRTITQSGSMERERERERGMHGGFWGSGGF
jgi:hypothetical protein